MNVAFTKIKLDKAMSNKIMEITLNRDNFRIILT